MPVAAAPAAPRNRGKAKAAVPAAVLTYNDYLAPPELAIEILSPSDTRRVQADKLRDYAAVGVREC